MSKYYETVDQINGEIDKINDTYDKILKGYFVLCGIYFIPCIIQMFISINVFAAIDLIALGIVLLSGYLSCRFRSNKWCIATGFCMIYSIAFGNDNDTFIEKLVYRLGWADFEINALLFIPTILLILITIYCNQRDKELKVQQIRYIERYRDKELLEQRMASGEQMRRNAQEQSNKKYGSDMAALDSSMASADNGKIDPNKFNYMDDI